MRRMRFVFLAGMSVLLALVLVPSVHAAAGVNLRWSRCSGDGGIRFAQRKEPPLAEWREHPAFGDLHGCLDGGLVTWVVGPSRQHGQ